MPVENREGSPERGSQSPDWAGTTQDRYDVHRFGTGRRALCDPEIMTYSTTTDHDDTREPYMAFRTRREIESSDFAYMYRFCCVCTEIPDISKSNVKKFVDRDV